MRYLPILLIMVLACQQDPPKKDPAQVVKDNQPVAELIARSVVEVLPQNSCINFVSHDLSTVYFTCPKHKYTIRFDEHPVTPMLHGFMMPVNTSDTIFLGCDQLITPVLAKEGLPSPEYGLVWIEYPMGQNRVNTLGKLIDSLEKK